MPGTTHAAHAWHGSHSSARSRLRQSICNPSDRSRHLPPEAKSPGDPHTHAAHRDHRKCSLARAELAGLLPPEKRPSPLYFCPGCDRPHRSSPYRKTGFGPSGGVLSMENWVIVSNQGTLDVPALTMALTDDDTLRPFYHGEARGRKEPLRRTAGPAAETLRSPPLGAGKPVVRPGERMRLPPRRSTRRETNGRPPPARLRIPGRDPQEGESYYRGMPIEADLVLGASLRMPNPAKNPWSALALSERGDLPAK